MRTAQVGAADMLGRLRKAGSHDQVAALLAHSPATYAPVDDPAAHATLDDPGDVVSLDAAYPEGRPASPPWGYRWL